MLNTYIASIYRCFMLKKATLALLALHLIAVAVPSLGAIGGNQTVELEPDIVGKINQTDAMVTPEEASLWLQLRTLWKEKVFWTRESATAIVSNSDDRDSVLERLSRVREDMAETLSPYLGNVTAKEYGDLIGEDLNLTKQYISAAASGDAAAQEDIMARWRTNADEIAQFENATLPYLSLEERRAMWHNHLNLTTSHVGERLDKDYNASIETFDLAEEQADIMADSLAEGIVHKFPEKFH